MPAPAYTQKSPGSVVRTHAFERRIVPDGAPESIRVEGKAFVPNPLPPKNIAWESTLGQLMPQLLRATHELARLDGLASNLENPHLLLYPLLLREAKLSSRIENTIASAEEVVLMEAGEILTSTDAEELRNYIDAVNYGIKSPLPVCNRLIQEMHQLLMRNVRGADKQPGQFRDMQAMIGRDGQGLATARFVPPPPGALLVQGMNDLEKFINDNDGTIPQLVRSAMAHYQFEAIHPFRDGNGRIGRAIAALSLCKGPSAPMSKPFVYLSGYFDAHRQSYYDHLLMVSVEDAWSAWIAFYLEAVADEAASSHLRVRKLLELRRSYIERVTEPRSSSLLPRIVDELFKRPWLRTPILAERLGISAQAAQRQIDRLVERKIVEQATQRDYKRIWVAREILGIIEEE